MIMCKILFYMHKLLVLLLNQKFQNSNLSCILFMPGQNLYHEALENFCAVEVNCQKWNRI